MASTDVLEQSLRIEAGFHEPDHAKVREILAPMARHLSSWEPESVDLAISVKDRDADEQKVTLQAWLPGLSPLVATASDRDLVKALHQVGQELVRQVDDAKDKRRGR